MVVGSLFQATRPINLCFTDDNGDDVGCFEYDKEKKQWTFTGNADKAAKQFAKFMFDSFRSQLDEHYGV